VPAAKPENERKLLVSFTLDRRVKGMLEALAEREGRSMSSTVERLVLAAYHAPAAARLKVDRAQAIDNKHVLAQIRALIQRAERDDDDRGGR
jgi:hypothetical protein